MPRRSSNKRKGRRKITRIIQQKPDKDSTDVDRRKNFHRLRNIVFLAVSGFLILSICIFWVNYDPTSQPTRNANVTVPRVAIVDGLFEKAPSAEFTEDMVRYLSDAGYVVDIYRGLNVTIDLLRGIGGYEILVLRVHSAMYTDNFLYVFSGEKYTESMYVEEQLAGAVRRGHTFDGGEPPYFALNSVFIGNLQPGGLNGTTLIMMGCNGTANPYVAQRFFQQGIRAYISWDGYVSLDHSDDAILQLIRVICQEGLNPQEAVEEVRKKVGPDPLFKSQLVCVLPD